MSFSKPNLKFVVWTSVLFCLACTGKSDKTTSPSGQSASSGKPSSIKVGLVLDKGGKDDKSFNAAAYRGATQAVTDFGIELKDVESPDDAAFEPALRTFAERGFPLVISVGFAQIDAVKKVAPQFPNTKFALIDGIVEGPNVASLMFAEHEGSYLVGYLAGLATKTGKVGFIGGMDIPLIRRFELGYSAGLKASNAKAVLTTNYVGINNTAWANPSKAKELAVGQYAKGVDIIFGAAGASNMGLFDAAEEKKAFAIGVDSNQNFIKPGRVLTSMLKRVDTAVYEIIRATKEEKFRSGTLTFGLADKGIDYAVDEHNQNLIAPYKEKLESVRAKIVDGEILVPDFYQINKK